MKRFWIIAILIPTFLLAASQAVSAVDGVKTPILKLVTVYEDGKVLLNIPQPAATYFWVKATNPEKTVKISLDLQLNGDEKLLILTELKRQRISAFSVVQGCLVGRVQGEGLALSDVKGTVYLDVEGFMNDKNCILVSVIDERDLKTLLEIRDTPEDSLFANLWIPATIGLVGLTCWLVIRKQRRSKEKW